ncbi:MAG: lysozyme inhibitor LprI family protein [Pseudomonadota bacterium]
MKSHIVLAAVLLSIGVVACEPNSKEAAPPESPFTCVRDGSMPEIKTCARDDMAKEEARMQRYFEAAMSRARAGDEGSVKYGPRTRQAAYLVESHQAWKAYAGVRCAGVREETSGGTMGGLGYMWCMTTAARQRTHDIWSDYLTYADSTPPVLPEPLVTVIEEELKAQELEAKDTPNK